MLSPEQSISWELVQNAGPQASLQTSESGPQRFGAGQLVFYQTLQVTVKKVMVENHCAGQNFG